MLLDVYDKDDGYHGTDEVNPGKGRVMREEMNGEV